VEEAEEAEDDAGARLLRRVYGEATAVGRVRVRVRVRVRPGPLRVCSRWCRGFRGGDTAGEGVTAGWWRRNSVVARSRSSFGTAASSAGLTHRLSAVWMLKK